MALRLYALALLTFAWSSSALAADGYATVNGDTTGGAAGPTVTVSNAADFATFAKTNLPYVVQVQGTIMTNIVSLRSNKTIIGVGTNATFIGRLNLSNGSNVVFRNLFVTDPTGGDGITIDSGTHHVWVDHCTFFDCSDGEVDITDAADFVTVSWCKFYYVNQTTHRFVNLIGADDAATNDIGKLHVTFHHNWWSTLCTERMPRVRYGRVHVYNNYYNSPGNNYCTAASTQSEVLVEKNVFENVDEPYRYQAPAGLLRAVSNATINCTGVGSFNDPVFAPPYSYAMDESNLLAGIVTNSAGAGQLGFNGAAFELWQLQYFDCILCPQAAAAADPDGDGLDNQAEFQSGTSPTNSASALQIISATRQDNDVVLTWSTAGGVTNAVQSTVGDPSGSYTNNFGDISGPIMIPGSGDATTNYVDLGGATNSPAQYYRIRLVP